MRLVEEESSYGSYGEAYEANCARYGREVDLPIVLFKRRCCNAAGQLVHDPIQELRMGVILICSKLNQNQETVRKQWEAVLSCVVVHWVWLVFKLSDSRHTQSAHHVMEAATTGGSWCMTPSRSCAWGCMIFLGPTGLTCMAP